MDVAVDDGAAAFVPTAVMVMYGLLYLVVGRIVFQRQSERRHARG
jgi:hypothetical protein